MGSEAIEEIKSDEFRIDSQLSLEGMFVSISHPLLL